MTLYPYRTLLSARSGLWAVLASLWPLAIQAVTITEINYHPPGGGAALEFVEISGDTTTPEDISGYHFIEGLQYRFPPGTMLRHGEPIVICADVEAMAAHYEIAPDRLFGNFSGRLDNGDDRVTLANHVGIPLVSLRYRDRGKWPTEADGTGHTLVLKNTRFDPGEPESWTWSPELGGSPGQPNFDDGDDRTTELIRSGDIWRFARGTEAFSSPPLAWTEAGFDDASWETGATGIGFGDGDDTTILDDMQNNYTTVAGRKRFTVSAEQLATGEFFLAIIYDDGFCAFVNGTEFARERCPDEITHDGTARAGHEANNREEIFPIPSESLVAGENVLAVIGYNTSIGSSDFSLEPMLRMRWTPDVVSSGTKGLVFNELYRSDPAGASWIEIHNRSQVAYDLSGFVLTDDPARPDPYIFPAGTDIEAGGFLSVGESESGLLFALPAVRVFLFSPEGLVQAAELFERGAPPGLAVGDYAEVRYPDGGALEWVTATPTRGEPNAVEATTDIVINEIYYQPPKDRDGEFIELTNRGAAPIDISGFRFDKGIQYTFEEETVLAPGAYLVVSQNPELTENVHGLTGVLGPFEGRLADGGENVRLVDAWGNPADEVRYHDDGEWAPEADGRGSSLELIDPRQDNSVGQAWEASDESEKSRWESLTYAVSSYRRASQSELHLFLVERGRCLIDDVAVRRGGGTNHIPNPGFETSTNPWVIEGTHQDSRRVTYDAHSGAACLELNASGKGDSTVNRIEIDTSPALTDGLYTVTLWARWLEGGSVIIGHGEFTAGPYGGRPGPSVNMSGNTLGGRVGLTVPENLGTPGAENSARRNHRDTTGSDNVGPVMSQVTQSPPSPEAGESVRISVRISDADGVASARLRYRQGHAGGAFSSVVLEEETSPAPSLEGTIRYSGTLPAFANGTGVVFYLEATDAAGVSQRFPRDAPSRTLFYRVQSRANHTLDSVKLVMDDARAQELNARRLHSNHLLDGSLIFDDEEVYHNVGMRYRGSPWGRPERTSYRIRFQKDRPIHPGLNAVNLTNRLNGPVEAASYFLTERCGTIAKPAPAPLYHFTPGYFNGRYLGTSRLYQPVGPGFLDKWYPGSDGPCYKAVARLLFNDAGQRAAYDGASFDYMGTNQENYRFYYMPVVKRSREDWERFILLMRTMDRDATSNTRHDDTIEQILDVEGFLRVMVPRMFVSDWDALGTGQGHNAYLALDTRDGLWETIPFDYNQAMPSNQLNFPVFPTFEPSYFRFISRPKTRRIYTRIASEFLDGYWSTTTAGPFFSALESVGIGMGSVRNFVSSRASIIRGQIRNYENVDFEITTNGGRDILTDEREISLQGTASVVVASMLLERNDDLPIPFEPTWTSATRWSAVLELPAPTNHFTLYGFDGEGALEDTVQIVVRTTAWPGGGFFVRGDSNGDGFVDLSDGVATLLYLFAGRSLDCEDAADADDNGVVNVTDSIMTLEFLFRDGARPASPFPFTGEDDTEDGLSCEN